MSHVTDAMTADGARYLAEYRALGASESDARLLAACEVATDRPLDDLVALYEILLKGSNDA